MSNQTFKWCWYHSQRARSGFPLCNWILSFSPSSFFFREAERKIFLSRLAARVKERAFGSGWITLAFFFFFTPIRSGVTMATPLEKMRIPAKWACQCLRVCISVHILVFVPESAAALCRAVTCSQISQRIYHPVNCLWVVDKMPPMHPHMKTLWG